MNSFLRRLIKLEPPDADRPLRIIWNDGSAAAEAEVARLEAQGFRVMTFCWLGRMDDDEQS